MSLDELEGARTGRDFIDRNVMKETNQFTYQHPFGINYRYINQVDDHNNWRHVLISSDREWVTKFWPDGKLAWYLDVSEANTALVSGHIKNYWVVQPSRDIWRALAI